MNAVSTQILMPLNKSGPVFKKCWPPKFAIDLHRTQRYEKNANMLTGYKLKFK